MLDDLETKNWQCAPPHSNTHDSNRLNASNLAVGNFRREKQTSSGKMYSA